MVDFSISLILKVTALDFHKVITNKFSLHCMMTLVLAKKRKNMKKFIFLFRFLSFCFSKLISCEQKAQKVWAHYS